MHLNKHFFKAQCLALLIVLCVQVSCKTTKDNFVEPVKDISGSWRVNKVVQNNIDITSLVDLSQFKVTFNKNNTYTLTGQVPFIVSENGHWAFNNPQYPFNISFTPTGSTAVTSSLTFPIVGNQYQMGINFILGCADSHNNYQYTLTKITQ